MIDEYLTDDQRDELMNDFIQIYPNTNPQIKYQGHHLNRKFRIVDSTNHIFGGWMPTKIFETIQKGKS